jgi:hypothetical protein
MQKYIPPYSGKPKTEKNHNWILIVEREYGRFKNSNRYALSTGDFVVRS